jgi:hypothetical protein
MRDYEAVGDVLADPDKNDTFEEKDFKPDDWRKLMNQARTEKLLRSKGTKLRIMAAAFKAKYAEEERRAKEKPLTPFQAI